MKIYKCKYYDTSEMDEFPFPKCCSPNMFSGCCILPPITYKCEYAAMQYCPCYEAGDIVMSRCNLENDILDGYKNLVEKRYECKKRIFALVGLPHP